MLALSDYLLNMVMMIGLGIAIDYSLLVVNRYRDERRRGRPHPEAVRETMRHAGRTIVFSGLVVSLGLALMLLLPVPFLRGFGVGGLLVPVTSIACALTLLPVHAAQRWASGSSAGRSPRAASPSAATPSSSASGSSHTRWVMRRAKVVAPLVAAALVLAALPLIAIEVGPSQHAHAATGSRLGAGADAARGRRQLLLERPDDDRRRHPRHRRRRDAQTAVAVGALERLLRSDPDVARVGPRAAGVDDRFLRIEVAGRADSASPQAQSFAAAAARAC